MKATASLLVLFAVVLGGGYLLYGQERPAATEPVADTTASSSSVSSMGSGTPSAAPEPSATAPAETAYTSAQVAANDSASSCWTSINGNVYNLTSWIGLHPGGEAAILSICGKDGTQAFEAQHGSSRDTEPKQVLETYKIGVLAS